MKRKCTLDKLTVDTDADVLSVESESGMKRRLSDIGVIRGGGIRCVGTSPLGDPRAYLVRGTVVALRNSDAAGITVIYQGG